MKQMAANKANTLGFQKVPLRSAFFHAGDLRR